MVWQQHLVLSSLLLFVLLGMTASDWTLTCPRQTCSTPEDCTGSGTSPSGRACPPLYSNGTVLISGHCNNGVCDYTMGTQTTHEIPCKTDSSGTTIATCNSPADCTTTSNPMRPCTGVYLDSVPGAAFSSITCQNSQCTIIFTVTE